ncbi:MAG: ArnT family glycosyltransferase [Nocardioidaceae bacterium]
MTQGARSIWSRAEAHPVRTLAIAIVFAGALRAPFLTVPYTPDEGGFLMVAHQWHGRGDGLYTNQWVDRPPLLLLVFKLADVVGGGPVMLRLLCFVFGCISISAAWWAGRTIAGARGAVAAALVTGAITSSFANDGFVLTGEAVGVAFVMSSCALLLHAVYGGKSAPVAASWAILAGLLAGMAFLSKQNFIDAGIFAAVLLGTGLRSWWRLALAGLWGLALPFLVTVAWARSPDGPGLNRLLVAMFRFRERSLNVIEDASLDAPLQRLKMLGVIAVVTGLVLLMWQVVAAVRRTSPRRNLRLAVASMLLYAVLSILVGASWWAHYLLQLVPVLAMGTALATRHVAGRLSSRVATSYCVVAATVITMALAGWTWAGHRPVAQEQTVADYLRHASQPDDSVVLGYGAPNIIEMSGLTTPYRYSWSLPVRTRDPHLKELVAVLAGPDAPTWLVEIGDFDWWGLDNAEFQQVRAERYRQVSTVCGHAIYELVGQSRELPPAPVCP